MSLEIKVPESREREIFLELMRPTEAHAIYTSSDTSAMQRFGVSQRTVDDIKRKGLARSWPPLD